MNMDIDKEARNQAMNQGQSLMLLLVGMPIPKVDVAPSTSYDRFPVRDYRARASFTFRLDVHTHPSV